MHGFEIVPLNMANQQQFAQNGTAIENGENFKDAIRSFNPFGLNFVFALLNGDIGY